MTSYQHRLNQTARVISVLLFSTLSWAEAPIMPDPGKTPGDVLTRDPNIICVPGYSKSVRDVPKAVKQQAYQNYGITRHQPGEYEVDHLISLELGGSNSVKNLWPESFVTQPLNAHVKDQLENKLHELICSRQLAVEQAQQAIAHNWIAAYEKYIGPLPTDNGVSLASSAPDFGRKAQADNLRPGTCPDSAPIKVSKKGIYHLPGDPSYDKTKAMQCLASPEAAEKAGFRKVRGR